MIAFLLMLAFALSRPYHVVAVKDLAASRHTHVEVTGKVTLVRHEADGDLHLRISDGKVFVVAEIIPTLVPGQDTHAFVFKVGDPMFQIGAVEKGQCVRVRGIRRSDNEPNHHWAEIHPVEQLAVVACR